MRLRFTILQSLAGTALIALFLILNLSPNHNESEFQIFNACLFHQDVTRGWPMNYQIESDLSELHGLPTESAREALRAGFRSQTRLGITSGFACCINLAALAATIAITQRLTTPRKAS